MVRVSTTWQERSFWSGQSIHHEHLVPEEGNTSWYLDTSCNQEVSYGRICSDESWTEVLLQRCTSDERSEVLDGPQARKSEP